MAKKAKQESNPEFNLAVHVLLDRSGSMIDRQDAAIKAFNGFIDGLMTALSPAVVTLTTFNSGTNVVIENKPVYEVPRLDGQNYRPRGGTDLYHGVIKALNLTEAVSARYKVLVIMTDGKDGSRMNLADLKSKWDDVLPIYVGCDHDVAFQSRGMGVKPENAMKFDGGKKAIEKSMLAAAHAALRYGASGKAEDAAFTANERK